MLYYLLFPLREQFQGFNLLQYITFRSASAAITALLFTFIIGPVFIRWLRKKQIGHPIKLDVFQDLSLG